MIVFHVLILSIYSTSIQFLLQLLQDNFADIYIRTLLK